MKIDFLTAKDIERNTYIYIYVYIFLYHIYIERLTALSSLLTEKQLITA